MTGLQVLLLAAVFFVTSGVNVVTGRTSLITLPAMFEVGVAPRTAIEANMFAATFLSVGGSLPSLGGKGLDRKRLPWLIVRRWQPELGGIG